MRTVICLAIMILSLAGCSHAPRMSPTSQTKQIPLTKGEEIRCREVAWEAVTTPEILERFDLHRITQDPFQFSDKQITCSLNADTHDQIEVLIPSGGQFALHPCFLRVTLKRETFEVLRIEEGCWA